MYEEEQGFLEGNKRPSQDRIIHYFSFSLSLILWNERETRLSIPVYSWTSLKERSCPLWVHFRLLASAGSARVLRGVCVHTPPLRRRTLLHVHRKSTVSAGGTSSKFLKPFFYLFVSGKSTWDGTPRSFLLLWRALV